MKTNWNCDSVLMWGPKPTAYTYRLVPPDPETNVDTMTTDGFYACSAKDSATAQWKVEGRSAHSSHSERE